MMRYTGFLLADHLIRNQKMQLERALLVTFMQAALS
jgi:hypothetical protein